MHNLFSAHSKRDKTHLSLFTFYDKHDTLLRILFLNVASLYCHHSIVHRKKFISHWFPFCFGCVHPLPHLR